MQIVMTYLKVYLYNRKLPVEPVAFFMINSTYGVYSEKMQLI